MKYIVSVAIDGRIDVEVDASNFREAKRIAEMQAGEQDMNKIEFVDINAVNAEDENGTFIDY